MENFLFAHFTGENDKYGEQVYFSVSKDGRYFNDLNNGQPILVSEIGEKGVRDPFLVRDEKRQVVYLIATDLRIASGRGWQAAQDEGSLNIVVWESSDLIHWSNPWLLPVALPEAGNVWAPEAIYDEEHAAFLVFWASKTQGKHKMYAAYTSDFKELSTPFLFLEKNSDVIDSTITKDEGRYYRFTKDETTSRIIMECSESLTGDYRSMVSPISTNLSGVEGPEIYQARDNQWYLIVDRFKQNLGYMILSTKELGKSDFTVMHEKDYSFGKNLKRHGGVLRITDEEYQRLVAYY